MKKNILEKIKVLSLALDVLVKTSKKHFFFICSLSILAGLPGLLNLSIWRKIIDEIARALISLDFNFTKIFTLFSMFFIIDLLGFIVEKILDYLTEIYSNLVECCIYNNLLEAVSKLSLETMERDDLQNDIKKVNTDSTSHILRAMDSGVELVKSLTTLIGTFMLLFSYEPIAIGFIIVSLLPLYLINKRSMEKIFTVYEDRYEKIRLLSFINDIVYKYDSFKELKVFQAFPFIQKENKKIFSIIINQDKKVKKRLLYQSSLSEVASMIFSYFIKIYLVVKGVLKALTIGQITMHLDATEKLQSACINFLAYLLNLYEDSLYLSAYMKVLDQVQMGSMIMDEGQVQDFSINTIQFKNVSFRYQSRENFVLKNINLTLEKGKIYCLVGFNGSGKSTLAKILAGLYQPSQGEVIINGINRNEYQEKAYFSHISIAFQEFFKLPMTIKENITISDIYRDDSKDRLNKAIRYSKAEPFLKALSKGYEERVGMGWNQGIDLSTGQWQRLNLARCFYKKAQVYILDEPTSNLDLKTEYALLQNIEEDKKDKIHLIITHRLINIKNVDQIIVLDQGKISSIGCHKDLFCKDPIYRDLFKIHSKING